MGGYPEGYGENWQPEEDSTFVVGGSFFSKIKHTLSTIIRLFIKQSLQSKNCQAAYYNNRTQRHAAGFTLTEVALVMGIVGIILSVLWWAAYTTYQNILISRTERDIGAMAMGLEQLEESFDNSFSTNPADYVFTGTTNSAGQPLVYAGAMNDILVDTTAIPPDMVDTSVTPHAIISPWLSSIIGNSAAVVLTVGVYVPTLQSSIPPAFSASFGVSPPIPPNTPPDTFEIALNGIPASACVRLVTDLTGAARDPNIVSVFINEWDAGTAVQTFPITPTIAADKCNKLDTNGKIYDDFAGVNASGNGFYDGVASIDIVYKFR